MSSVLWDQEFDDLPVKVTGVSVGAFSGVAVFSSDRLIEIRLAPQACGDPDVILDWKRDLPPLVTALRDALQASILDLFEEKIADRTSPEAAAATAADLRNSQVGERAA